jgi:hypothetical protein
MNTLSDFASHGIDSNELKRLQLASMDSHEWRNTVDWWKMGWLLFGLDSHKYNRKLMLFFSACCRQNWEYYDERVRRGIILTEAAADSLPIPSRIMHRVDEESAEAVASMDFDNLAVMAGRSIHPAFSDSGYVCLRVVREYDASLQAVRCAHHLRDLVFDPFQTSPVFDTPIIENTKINAIAQDIYYNYQFSLMPYLADALEDIGCSDESILSHCRQETNHIRGCWVIDGLLSMHTPSVSHLLSGQPSLDKKLRKYLSDSDKNPFKLYTG